MASSARVSGQGFPMHHRSVHLAVDPDLTCVRLHAQPVVSSAVDFFFGRVDARVPPSTTFHERLADLLLTGFTFAAEDPGRIPCGCPCFRPASCLARIRDSICMNRSLL